VAPAAEPAPGGLVARRSVRSATGAPLPPNHDTDGATQKTRHLLRVDPRRGSRAAANAGQASSSGTSRAGGGKPLVDGVERGPVVEVEAPAIGWRFVMSSTRWSPSLGQLGLAARNTVDRGEDERRRIEDRPERADPRQVVVARSEA
jgi:hypothetical protein